MAKKPAEGRVFNISVVGLSGTEKDKGLIGIGKSCLCNRFIHQEEDKYHSEHISVLSQSDFAGRVINNDHFLYWGEVTKTDEGNNYTFHVVEQTEFIDDVSFTPFKTGRTDHYLKRSVQTKLQSAEKLMYICKDQLGLETDADSPYEQKPMPDGKLNIDGFICCFDVSNSQQQQRSIEKQSEFTTTLLTNAIKTKKPVVLATTKSDAMDEKYLREAERIVNRKDYKGSIPLVETSAENNVNVELAFMMLAHMLDKAKTRTKPVPYAEASRARKELLDVALEAFKNLLKNKITDSKTTMAGARKKLEKESDYVHFVDLFGFEKARKLVKQHTIFLRDEQIKKREQEFMKKLPDVIQHFLPELDTIADRSWNACQSYIEHHEDFNDYFVEVCDAGASWKYTDFVENTTETRLPFDLLQSKEAENCFLNHVNALQAAHRRAEFKREFRHLLVKYVDTPGTTLEDNYSLFLGKDCYTGLQENERQQVYDDHQRDLKNSCRKEFQELLWERPAVFRSLNLNQRLTEGDLNVIYNSLNDDQRFRKLYKLEDDRKVMLLNHVVFLERPSIDRCFFHSLVPNCCVCTECRVHYILESRRTHSSGDESSRRSLPPPPDILDTSSGYNARPLNLVLLGKEGLATELYREIRSVYEEDKYKLGSRTYNLDYRPIEGDVSQEQNTFAPANFKPHGCICVFTSPETLDYINSSLKTVLRSAVASDDGHSLEDLPIVVMLAYSPAYTSTELRYLRENGRLLASSLQSEFVDIPYEDLAEKRKFYPEQIEQALTAIVQDPISSLSRRILQDTEPDLRILMCLMCADPYPMDVPVKPFLNEASCIVLSDPDLPVEEENVLTIDSLLDHTTQKVEITVTSYHGGHMLRNKGEIFHGYILAYSAKRKASLATMRSFAEPLIPAPILILAVTEGTGNFYNMEHNQNIVDGNNLAKCLQARFLPTTANFTKQSATQVYGAFLKQVWDRKEEYEVYFGEEASPPPAYDPQYRRPPVPLPNTLASKSSTSNSQSTEDSEPLYDQPMVYKDHSDSERASSPSPPPPPLPSSSPPDQDIYSIVHSEETLVKPSMLKARRSEFAGHHRELYRKSFPVGETEGFKMRTPMSQSMTEHLDSDLGPQPQGPFRKSRSMKLAVKHQEEAWAINEHHQQTKASTYPSGINQESIQNDHDDDWHGYSHNASGDPQDTTLWAENRLYDRSSMVTPLKSKSISSPLNLAQYNLARKSPKSSRQYVEAPLAEPEKIEIAEEYGEVMDAIFLPNPESDTYASVDDALPAGKLQRIKSTSRNKEKGTDSEESEFSSLERERKSSDLYSKVNRKPTPHKKKHKHRSYEDPAYRQMYDQDPHLLIQGNRGRSNSPSEDSGGTGDELQSGRRAKKHSLRRKMRTPSSTSGPTTFSPNMSDSDIVGSPPGRPYDDDLTSSRDYSLDKYVGPGEGEIDPNDSGRFGTWWRRGNVGKDAKEKKARDEERRRLKEDEKKQKAQQKQRRKKDSKVGGPSESGISLSDFPMSPSNPSVPLFIEKCVEFIEEEEMANGKIGMSAEGIYRIPGNKAQVDLLTQKYQEDSNVDITVLDIQVNAVATVLKAFFSELSDPLVPVHLYDELIEASSVVDKSSRILALRGVLLKMHPLNFEVLKFLITHLNRVTAHVEENSMDSKNLSRCWWPTLIRMDFKSIEQMTQYSRIPEEILQTLIEQSGFFFHGENEV